MLVLYKQNTVKSDKLCDCHHLIFVLCYAIIVILMKLWILNIVTCKDIYRDIFPNIDIGISLY